MSKFMSFVNEVLARLEGDQDKVIAEKNARKAVAAVKGQLSALEGQRVEDEDVLSEAQEALAAAKYPTEKITGLEGYVKSVADAQEQVDTAQDSLDGTQESIEFFEQLLEEYTK